MQVLVLLFCIVVCLYASKQYEILVDNVNFAVLNREDSESSNGYTQLKQGDKTIQQVQLNFQRKIKLNFVVKDKQKNAPVSVHQAFVVFVHQTTQREVIYVAEQNEKKGLIYTFELNLKTHQNDFSGVSGQYSLSLILGDALASNSIYWHLADVTITVPSVRPPDLPKSKKISYEILPVIQHKFAQPEPRPSQLVSDTFAVFCALPLLVLFILWLRVGINFGNMQFSFWALGFHIGLTAIFGLYFWYWVQLNMFQTLQYLFVIGTLTFVCGNRFLHNFNEFKKNKTQ